MNQEETAETPGTKESPEETTEAVTEGTTTAADSEKTVPGTEDDTDAAQQKTQPVLKTAVRAQVKNLLSP